MADRGIGNRTRPAGRRNVAWLIAGLLIAILILVSFYGFSGPVSDESAPAGNNAPAGNPQGDSNS